MEVLPDILVLVSSVPDRDDVAALAASNVTIQIGWITLGLASVQASAWNLFQPVARSTALSLGFEQRLVLEVIFE